MISCASCKVSINTNSRSSSILDSLGKPSRRNLVPRVLWLFGQRVGASRDSGVLEFSYRKISAVKQWKPLWGSQSKNYLIFFEFSSLSTGAHPLTKKPEDSGNEIDPDGKCQEDRISPGNQPLAKESEDSGYEIGRFLKVVVRKQSSVKRLIFPQ